MRSIKLKTWLLWSFILIALGLMADFFLLHHFLRVPQIDLKNISAIAEPRTTLESPPTRKENLTVTEARGDSKVDNFRESLQACAPNISNLNVDSPESLIEYLSREIGLEKKELILENYHLELKDGSKRRIQLLGSDNTNSSDKLEMRLFKLDAEGIPERVPLPSGESLQNLLTLGKITHHELRTLWVLKNQALLNLELHDDKVFEFQFNYAGKVLSCRYRNCFCP